MGKAKHEFRASACLSARRFFLFKGVCSPASVVVTTGFAQVCCFFWTKRRREFSSCNAMVHAKNGLLTLVS